MMQMQTHDLPQPQLCRGVMRVITLAALFVFLPWQAIAVEQEVANEVSEATPTATADARAAGDLIVVQGAGGRDEYAQMFAKAAAAWQAMAEKVGMQYHGIGPASGAPTDRDQLDSLLKSLASGTASTVPRDESTPIYLVLLGHGTYNQGKAKFNLQGPDLTTEDLATWLANVKRPVALINCSSASAPFLEKLSSDRRVVITATRAGTEQNIARFGEYLALAIADPTTDLDHDGAISLLEAFVRASHDTQQFYADASRLATEHAVLDDNGDQAGTPADFFRGIRAVRKADDGRQVDGFRAHQWLLRTFSQEPPLTDAQVSRRTELESQLEDMRPRKKQLGEDVYYAEIEPLLIELARMVEPSSK